MKIKENINIKKNPISTTLGIFLTIVGASYCLLPMIFSFLNTEFKYEPNYRVGIGFAAWGVISIIAPDDAKGLLLSIIKKKTENL